MDIFKEYILQNWALILILIAFAIALKITVFLNRSTIRRMYFLIIAVFLLSIIVFVEFYLEGVNKYKTVREIMIAIRYSSTPLIIGLIIYSLVRKARWYILLPAGVLTIVNIISIFTGIVFSINEAGVMERGILGYLPYFGVGGYSLALVYVLFKQSNKQAAEIIPILFLAFALLTGIIFPFIIGKEYFKIFCPTMAIGIFVYYVFLILQLTKKDALTGLLNRHAYYALMESDIKDITAFVSIDMNGLKAINDNEGHLEGDEALMSLASCFTKAAKIKQYVFRIGGDEFIIVCRKTTNKQLLELVDKIKYNVSQTKYNCSIGYCYAPNGSKDLEAMVKESDEMMYKDKANYYLKTGKDRRAQ